MLLLTTALMLQAVAGPEPTEAEAYADCVRMARTQPARAAELAQQWIAAAGGGVPARHCLALTQLETGDAAGASATLEQAATLSEGSGGKETAALYAQAGNAALIAEDAPRAEELFGRGLVALGRFGLGQRANLLIDRARARQEQGKIDGARADLTEAVQAAPGLHPAWLLLAAAERQAGNLAGAESAIREAIKLAPDDEDTLKEAALIAASE